MIVSMHSSCGYLVSNNFIDMFFKYINIVFDLAVPLFFLISVFLFYWKNIEIMKDCINKLFHRMKSTLLPFFVYSFVAALAYYLYKYIFKSVDNNQAFSVVIIDFFRDVWTSKYDPPIWFLKTLFEMQVISVLFFALIHKRKNIYLLLFYIFLIVNIYLKPPYSSPPFWFPIIMLGMWLSFSDYLIYLKQNKLILIFIAIALLTSTILLGIFKISTSDSLYYLYRIIGGSVFGLLLIGIGLEKIHIPIISYYSFFVFVLHVPVLSVIRRILWSVFSGIGAVGCILTYIFTIACSIISIFALGLFIKKNFPKIWRFINGNR